MKMIVLIIAVSVLSTSQILRYYFSYEDFSLLYGVQFPNDPHSIFLYPGFVAYRFLRYILVPQYFLFGYEPFGYYLVSFLLFLLVVVVFYKFLLLILPKPQRIALFGTLILASGYVGIESLTWNVAGGQIHLAFLVISLLTLIYAIIFLRNRKIYNLAILVLLSFVSIYFFQFRSYLLFLWAPFLVFFKRLEEHKGISLKLFAGVGVLIIFLSFFFSQSIQLVIGRIQHVNLDIRLLLVFLKNLGNLLFPSDYFESINNGQILSGVLSLLIFILPPIYFIWRKRKFSYLLAFFSVCTLASLAAIMLVIAFVGQIPTIWLSSHRFYIVLLPFISGYLALVLSMVPARIQMPLLVIILVTHIFFSNKAISDRWESLSRHLRYFYETITIAVPRIDKPTVLLTTLTRPYPPGPFVSGSDAGSAHFLAGFYGRRFDDFLLATEPLEAVKMLIDNNLTTDDIYAFDYKRDDIIEETDKVRNVLINGQRMNLKGEFESDGIEFKDLEISSATPVFLRTQIKTVIGNTRQGVLILDGKMSVYEHFALFFEQEVKRSKMAVSSDMEWLSEEHSVDNVVDGKYDTTWIPKEWKQNGASIIVDLGIPRRVYKVVWASSRVAPWEFRSPSEYEVGVSINGQDFNRVANAENASALKTGQFFTVELDGREIRYVRLTIKKTRGGWTPAVDEIEVFDNPIAEDDLRNYFSVKNTPSIYFPDKNMATAYWRQILKQKIPVEINWRTDTDGDYPAGQEKKIYVEGLGVSREYIILLPKTGRVVKSIRIRPSGFPAELVVSKMEVWQPSLQEFYTNKSLWSVK